MKNTENEAWAEEKNLVSFTVSGYDEYPIDSIEEMYVDRYANSARLMIKDKSGKEFPIARFSLGFADKFEKFSQRVNCTAKNEPIDDRLLEGVKTHCPTCGEPYPDPNRPVCPRCVDRRSVFKRLLSMFGEFKGAVFLILLTIVLSNVLPYFRRYSALRCSMMMCLQKTENTMARYS